MEGRGAFTVYWYDFDPDGGLGRCCVTYLFLPGLIVSPWRPFSQAYRHHPRAPGATLNSIPRSPPTHPALFLLGAPTSSLRRCSGTIRSCSARRRRVGSIPQRCGQHAV